MKLLFIFIITWLAVAQAQQAPDNIGLMNGNSVAIPEENPIYVDEDLLDEINELNELDYDNPSSSEYSKFADILQDLGGKEKAKRLGYSLISYNIKCTFESSYCRWRNGANNDFNWKRVKLPQTSKENSGFPIIGKRDFYIRTDTTYAKEYRTRARLVSKVLPQKFPICLQFWYHMESTDESSGLRVYIRPSGGKLVKLWDKKGDQGQHWKFAQIQIESNINYKIIFESFRGKAKSSKISIDTINYRKRSCEPQLFTDPLARFDITKFTLHDKKNDYSNSLIRSSCELYSGSVCAPFYGVNKTETSAFGNQEDLEQKLSETFAFIRAIGGHCEEYALKAICYHNFAPCAGVNYKRLICKEECQALMSDYRLCKAQFDSLKADPGFNNQLLPLDCYNLPTMKEKFSKCTKLSIPDAYLTKRRCNVKLCIKEYQTDSKKVVTPEQYCHIIRTFLACVKSYKSVCYNDPEYFLAKTIADNLDKQIPIIFGSRCQES
ncbi:MAM and LDL-receptor class A domain-containing protein 1 [Trichoplax sp. H2]|nr:MAM and LDL-receptor class A domain-containing protein 1 [Trichoplax sp. H2]|eukprot:RDD45427.1 MAM and LDL-receptor class A domain-containing protein 1 [Trichoplax sp. H2]